MANKFQKSVLERLEQEAGRQKQKLTENKQAEPIKKEQAIKGTEIPPSTRKTENPPVPDTIPSLPEQPATPNISGYLIREHQRLAKNKTFYLDADVIEAVKAAARSQAVTDSKLVNDILRCVLGLGQTTVSEVKR